MPTNIGASSPSAFGVSVARVSVVVPTRNRPEHAAACAISIFAASGSLELIIVDQSDDRATEKALSTIQDQRLRYVRTETRGVTSARNLGLTLSEGDIIAFTDDDCRVGEDWIERIVDIFAADSKVVVVCGFVRVPHEIQHLGWAEGFEPQSREWEGRYPPFRQWGISANFSLRRWVPEQVGPFDPMLGTGAPLRSGGETDLLFRVLRAGFKVVNAREVIVDHVGIRKLGTETRHLVQGYGVGTAAALVKHVRLGDLAALRVYFGFLAATAIEVSAKFISRKRPIGASFLTAFLRGTLASFRFRVDRQRQQYAPRRSLRFASLRRPANASRGTSK